MQAAGATIGRAKKELFWRKRPGRRGSALETRQCVCVCASAAAKIKAN